MKDPAALLYIDKWLVSTKGMKGNAKGWYLNLILYQYDKGELPNDIEELANLCDVRISEFEEFKQVFKQVLEQKFIVNDNGCLQNEFANEILRKRETFKEKRSDAGKLGYVIKYYRNNYKHKEGFEEYLKENLVIDFDIKNNQMLKQVLKQNYKLYININKDKDINKENINKENKSKEENIKEETENKKSLNEIGILEMRSYADLSEYTKNDELWIEAICMNLKLKKETVLNELKHFPIAQKALGRENTNLKDFKNHFSNYLAKKANELRTSENQKANSVNIELERIMKYKADYMANVNGGKK